MRLWGRPPSDPHYPPGSRSTRSTWHPACSAPCRLGTPDVTPLAAGLLRLRSLWPPAHARSHPVQAVCPLPSAPPLSAYRFQASITSPRGNQQHLLALKSVFARPYLLTSLRVTYKVAFRTLLNRHVHFCRRDEDVTVPLAFYMTTLDV